MAAGLCGVEKAVTKVRADELLTRVGLGDWQQKKVGSFSKGMKQRVGIAQALVNDPEVVFLDEPTDGVDPEGRRDIRVLLEQLRDEGKTVFVNSHLLGELEMVCDRVAILSKGEIKLEGALKDLIGQKGIYRITCSGLDPKMVATLSSTKVSVEGADLIVDAEKASEVMPVLDQLRQEGVVIESFVREKNSLEDLFLETVGGDSPGAAPRQKTPPPISK